MKNIIFDIETNGLENCSRIWLIICKDISTNTFYSFRDPDLNPTEFVEFAKDVDLWISHNGLGFDIPVINRLLDLNIPVEKSLDTLIISKLADYPRDGHSIEQYGLEFGYPKINYSDFSKYSPEMEEYCVRDVKICHKIYLKYLKYINNPDFRNAIVLEHKFQLIVNDLHNNGFAFDSVRATKLLEKVTLELSKLDKDILEAFPPKLKLIREIVPKETKHGTLHKGDFRWVTDGDLSIFNGGSFCRCDWVPFNPSSTKQIVDVLHSAGWSPVNKTKTRIELERTINRLKYKRDEQSKIDLSQALIDQRSLGIYGYKVDETNISTLPDSAPKPASLLARRILLESRRRTLTEWLSLVREDGRIHSEFFAIGAWTMRMATRKPNVQNIPRDDKLFGKEMRALWQAGKKRLLCGVDADSIQFRIAAHYINDPSLTKKIVEGKKSDKTDPHSYNMKIIGSFCKNRNDSKQTLFSLILGGGIPKLAEILRCKPEEAEQGRDNLYREYPGLVALKNELVVADAKRGWFIGIDGRPIRIPGDTFSERKHLCPSGYLQSGEGIVMKYAAVKWYNDLADIKDLWKFVNLIHDENQTEGPNDFEVMLRIARVQAEAIKWVGEELKLNCPLAGSFWDDGRQDYAIGTTWAETH